MSALRLARIAAFLVLAFCIVLSSDSSGVGAQPKPAKKKKKNNNNNTPLPPMFGVPATAMPAKDPGATIPTPNGSVKTTDTDVDFYVAESCKVQQLKKFDTGLNFVAGSSEDIEVGQKLTLSMATKDDKEAKAVENVSGTLVTIGDSGTKLTLRIAVPEGKPAPSGAGKECKLVSIRTVLDDAKDK